MNPDLRAAMVKAGQPTPLTKVAPPANDAIPVVVGDSGAALLAKPPPVKWLCRALHLAAGRPTLMVAFAGAGKTFLVVDIVVALTNGAKKCLGSIPLESGGSALWLNFEMPRWELIRRVQRIAKGAGLPADCSGKLEIVSRQHLAGFTLTSAGAKAMLVRKTTGVALCVIDSLRASVEGLEENSSEIRRPLDMLLEVSDITGCCFMVIHHEGKPGENPKTAIMRTRGSGAIMDAVDTSWHIVPGDHALTIEQGKASLAQKAESVHVRLVDVGLVDPDSGRSEGLRVEWVPVEELDDLEGQDPPKVVRAREAILGALATAGALTDAQITRGAQFVKGNGDSKRKALKRLSEDGLIRKTPTGWVR